jgi:hypothetical protein
VERGWTAIFLFHGLVHARWLAPRMSLFSAIHFFRGFWASLELGLNRGQIRFGVGPYLPLHSPPWHPS